MVPDDVADFGRLVASRLTQALGQQPVGVYFVGSIALGGYVAGESDVDIVGVSEHPIPDHLRPTVVDAVLDAARGCPARGLEFTLYRREIVESAPQGADFEVNANGGPRMPRSVHPDAAVEPGFWYVIDRAVARRAGVPIVGPHPLELFADVPRGTLLRSMGDSMRWHREHEGATLYSVLNACRAWRFAAEDVLGSKLEGAAWARTRWRQPEVIDAGVALRRGGSADLDTDQVTELLDHVAGVLTTAGGSAPEIP